MGMTRIAVLGGGVMGGDIAAWCALQGLLVTVQDLDAGRLARVVARAGDLFGDVRIAAWPALLEQTADEVNALLKNADAAMYSAKRAGRNAYRFFDSSLARA